MFTTQQEYVSLHEQHKEIQNRLDRYCNLFLDNQEDVKQTDEESFETSNIDIFEELACLRDSLTDKKVDLCFCERENVCQCSSEEICDCDGENFYTVSQVDIIDGSNSNIIFDFSTLENVTIPRLKNVRFFTLDKETDEEKWIMDLRKIIEKRKKKKVVSEYFLKTRSYSNLPATNTDRKYIEYEIFDVPHLDGKRIEIKIDYLQYHIR